MKSLLKSKKAIVAAVLLFVIFVPVSCGKKWKKTTNVDFKFLISSTPLTFGKDEVLSFPVGTMTIAEVDFSGDRKQGGGVNFSDNRNPLSIINLRDGTSNPSIHYKIPQGVYTNINLIIKAVQQNVLSSLSLTGVYVDDDQKSIPLNFELGTDQIFNVKATDNKGSNEIVLIEDTPAKCEVTFDVNYWLGTVTKQQIENAQKYFINGDSTIVISKDKNQNIYNTIASRVNQSTTAVFQ